MLIKKTLTTGGVIVTEHVTAEDVFELAKRLKTSPLQVFARAYDEYASRKHDILIDSYANFRANGIIPEYVKQYVRYHNEHPKEGIV